MVCDLQDKTVFITGGASGIGAAAVRKFVESGAKVFFADIDETKALGFVSEFPPGCAGFAKANVASSAEVERAVADALEFLGGIDVVFANAGIHHSGDLLSTSEEAWEQVMGTNLKGTYLTLKFTLPWLVQGGGGSVILMGSDQSLVGKRRNFVYGATKGAIAQMAKNLALDYAEHNIRVNCVCPGTIDTPLSRLAIRRSAQRFYEGDVERVMNIVKNVQPIRRLGLPKEVAEVVAFLASDASSFMTGALIPIDGGYTAQ